MPQTRNPKKKHSMKSEVCDLIRTNYSLSLGQLVVLFKLQFSFSTFQPITQVSLIFFEIPQESFNGNILYFCFKQTLK